ncbi:hypothetical protein EP51_14295 [Rhodococcus opacus]|uniref:Uncharacterized protein n=1 Tax=Rhodococcus opacus TaxID=37919 RepID=A0A076EQK5_RHOOP|nr:hypothetical protein EP51_14295 [Rhodococcus opacus]
MAPDALFTNYLDGPTGRARAVRVVSTGVFTRDATLIVQPLWQWPTSHVRISALGRLWAAVGAIADVIARSVTDTHSAPSAAAATTGALVGSCLVPPTTGEDVGATNRCSAIRAVTQALSTKFLFDH